MRHLLLYTCIFIRLKNNSYYQITGTQYSASVRIRSTNTHPMPTGTMIHELGVRPRPVPVPHFVPYWIEHIFPSVERKECCKNEDAVVAPPTNAMIRTSRDSKMRNRKRKSSCLQKEIPGQQEVQVHISSCESESAIQQALKEGRHLSRRQRKRMKVSVTDPTSQTQSLPIRSNSRSSGRQDMRDTASTESNPLLSVKECENILQYFKKSSTVREPHVQR